VTFCYSKEERLLIAKTSFNLIVCLTKHQTLHPRKNKQLSGNATEEIPTLKKDGARVPSALTVYNFSFPNCYHPITWRKTYPIQGKKESFRK
jgi:hypothetical protein